MKIAALLTTKNERDRDAIQQRIVEMSNDIPLSRLTMRQLEELTAARSIYAGGYQPHHLLAIEKWLTPLVKAA